MMAIIFPLARVLQKSGFGNFPFWDFVKYHFSSLDFRKERSMNK